MLFPSRVFSIEFERHDITSPIAGNSVIFDLVATMYFMLLLHFYLYSSFLFFFQGIFSVMLIFAFFQQLVTAGIVENEWKRMCSRPKAVSSSHYVSNPSSRKFRSTKKNIYGIVSHET